MKIQRGIVKYKDRNDIVCTYALTDDGKQYYFLDETDTKKLSNGNRIATSVLVEAVDPMVKATNIGVIDQNGVVVVPFENRSIRLANDNVLIVEKAVPTSQSVLDAIELRSDPTAATQLVSTPATIKDRLKAQMGVEGNYLFNDQFSEATICDINGTNLVQGECFSFISLANNSLYLSKNTVDSPISVFSLTTYELVDPQSVQVPTEAIDISAAVVDPNVVEGALTSDAANVQGVVAPVEGMPVNIPAVPVEGMAAEAPIVPTEGIVAEAPIVPTEGVVAEAPIVSAEGVVAEAPIVPAEGVVAEAPIVPAEGVVAEAPIVPAEGVVAEAPIVPAEGVVAEAPIVPVEGIVAEAPIVPAEGVVAEAPIVPAEGIVAEAPIVPEEGLAAEVPIVPEEIAAEAPIAPEELAAEAPIVPEEIAAEAPIVPEEIAAEAPIVPEGEVGTELPTSVDEAVTNSDNEVVANDIEVTGDIAGEDEVGLESGQTEMPLDGFDAPTEENTDTSISDDLKAFAGGIPSDVEEEPEAEVDLPPIVEEDTAEAEESVSAENTDAVPEAKDSEEADTAEGEEVEEAAPENKEPKEENPSAIEDIFSSSAASESEPVEDEKKEEIKTEPINIDPETVFAAVEKNKGEIEDSEDSEDIIIPQSRDDKRFESIRPTDNHSLTSLYDSPLRDEPIDYGLNSSYTPSYMSQMSPSTYDTILTDLKPDRISYDSYGLTSSDNLMADVARSMSELMRQNRDQRAVIAQYQGQVDSLESQTRILTEKFKDQSMRYESLSGKLRSLDEATNRLESRNQLLENRVHDQEKIIASQDRELKMLRPQVEGKQDLVRLLADARTLLGSNSNYGYSDYGRDDYGSRVA